MVVKRIFKVIVLPCDLCRHGRPYYLIIGLIGFPQSRAPEPARLSG